MVPRRLKRWLICSAVSWACLAGDRQRHGQRARHVEAGGDHAAVQAALDEVADQVAAHGEAQLRPVRRQRGDLEAEQFVEVNAPLEDVPQQGIHPLLFERRARRWRGGGAHRPASCGIGATGVSCQISALYSAMVRSVENLPLAAVLRMLMRVQRS